MLKMVHQINDEHPKPRCVLLDLSPRQHENLSRSLNSPALERLAFLALRERPAVGVSSGVSRFGQSDSLKNTFHTSFL